MAASPFGGWLLRLDIEEAAARGTECAAASVLASTLFGLAGALKRVPDA